MRASDCTVPYRPKFDITKAKVNVPSLDHQLFVVMFALFPDGDGPGGKGSALSANLWFFTRVGLYFAAIRSAYLFFGKDNKTFDK